MAISKFSFDAYDLGSFRILFVQVRTDLTADMCVTYIDNGQYIKSDTLAANEGFQLRSRLRLQGYVASEVTP